MFRIDGAIARNYNKSADCVVISQESESGEIDITIPFFINWLRNIVFFFSLSNLGWNAKNLR